MLKQLRCTLGQQEFVNVALSLDLGRNDTSLLEIFSTLQPAHQSSPLIQIMVVILGWPRVTGVTARDWLDGQYTRDKLHWFMG